MHQLFDMEFFANNPSYIWLTIGVILIIGEFFAAPGLGIVFAGLGALATGGLIEFGVIESTTAQIITFCAATAIWALLLWKPLKRALSVKAKGKGESHIIGTEAKAAKGGVSKVAGNAVWSGTIMKARLSKDAKLEKLEEDAIAKVIDLDGSTLILDIK